MLNRPCCLRHMPASLPSDESQQQQQQQRAASGTRAVYDTPALFHSALSYCIGLSRRGVLIAWRSTHTQYRLAVRRLAKYSHLTDEWWPSRRMCRVNLNSLNYSFALLHQKVISKLPRQQHQRIIAVSHIIYHCDPESCSLVRRWSKRSRSIEICTTKDLEVHWVIEATDQCYFCCAMLSFFITLDGSTKTKTHSCTKWKIYTSTEEKIKEKQ